MNVVLGDFFYRKEKALALFLVFCLTSLIQHFFLSPNSRFRGFSHRQPSLFWPHPNMHSSKKMSRRVQGYIIPSLILSLLLVASGSTSWGIKVKMPSSACFHILRRKITIKGESDLGRLFWMAQNSRGQGDFFLLSAW